jgi:putative acetyltransferase
VDLVVAPDDPRRPDVVALLEVHLAFMHATFPPEHVHALDLDGLCDPAITFLSVRDPDGVLLGVGALRQLDPTHAEIKSMHTVAARRGSGIARTMLAALLDLARSRGCSRVSLETGAEDAFAPARRLYESVGFRRCPPFGDYWDNEHSMCMTLALT